MAAPIAKYVTSLCVRHISTRYSVQRRLYHLLNVTSKNTVCPENGFDLHCKKRQSFCRNVYRLHLHKVSQFCTVAHEERRCWKCQSKTNAKTELFFCNCGVVQSVPSDLTFFKAMGVEETFEIDVDHLSQLYKDLQRLLHPDKFSQNSKEEQDLAERQSSFVNKAYSTLLKPLTRGIYLLEICGIPTEDTDNYVEPGFLMEVMETNEDLAEAEGNDTAVAELEKINKSRIELCIQQVSEHFRDDNLVEAKQALVRLRYFTNIEDKIKQMYRKKMDH